METREVEVFTIKELPEKIREKVLNRWREHSDFDYDYMWENAIADAENRGIYPEKKSLSFDLYRNDLDFKHSIDMDKIADEFFKLEQLALKMVEDEEYDELYEELHQKCEEKGEEIADEIKHELLQELKDAYDYEQSDEYIMDALEDARFLADGHRVD